MKKGYIPARKTPGGHWRFYEPDLILALSVHVPNDGGPAPQRRMAGPHTDRKGFPDGETD